MRIRKGLAAGVEHDDETGRRVAALHPRLGGPRRPPAKRPTRSCWSVSSARGNRPPLQRWWRGTVLASWASAGACCATNTPPRTPSRTSSSCWRARPARSANGRCWPAGCTGPPAASRSTPAPTPLRRRGREALVEAGRSPDDPAVEAAARELSAVLDEEVGRLPERYRSPIIHCHVEGRTREEAARRLGCSPRTLQRRLERGRALLRARLVRRGVTLAAAPHRPGRLGPSGGGCRVGPAGGRRHASRRRRPRRGALRLGRRHGGTSFPPDSHENHGRTAGRRLCRRFGSGRRLLRRREAGSRDAARRGESGGRRARQSGGTAQGRRAPAH